VFRKLAADVDETNKKHGCVSAVPVNRDGSSSPSNAAAQLRNYTIRTILVVDDEPQMRRVLRATLIAREYTVVEAASGEEALKIFNVEPCDCVLLDLALPGLDGIGTCRAIRRTSEVPIIVVSIRDSEQDHAAAQEAGADDYVTKPFGVDELLARIQAVSQRKADSHS
jgi:two-component system KDP operon response regulator KdpE